MGVLYFRTISTTSRSSKCCHHDSLTNGTFHLFLPFNDHQFIFNQTCIIICKVVKLEIFARKHPTAPLFRLCMTYEQRDTASHFQIIKKEHSKIGIVINLELSVQENSY